MALPLLELFSQKKGLPCCRVVPSSFSGRGRDKKLSTEGTKEKLTEEHRGVDVLGWLDRFLG